MWIPFKEGKTISQKGSENGIILIDEELPGLARITLEKDGYTPYGITCGIYGQMAHTAFAGKEEEAMRKYEAMKCAIEKYVATFNDPDYEYDSEWCEWFTDHF